MTKLDKLFSTMNLVSHTSYKILKKAISFYLHRIKRYMLLLEIGVCM